MTSPLLAANAYTAQAGLMQKSDLAAGGAQASIGSSQNQFADYLKTTVDETVANGQVAESKSVDFLQGKADLTDVVTAIAETEVAMDMVVSVRDRVIAAYEEVLRMPI